MRILLWIAAGLGITVATGGAEPPPLRRYTDGPLTATDFAMVPPTPRPTLLNGIPQVANTYSEIRYTLKWKGQETHGVMTLTVSEFDMFAVLLPDRSWNTRSRDLRILDHEQGHFDISEIYARQGRELFQQKIKDKKLVSRAKTEAEAKKQLDELVKKEFADFYATCEAAQKAYDVTTRHGLEIEAQATARKEQREKLAAN